MFTNDDIKYLKNNGIENNQIEEQFDLLKKNNSYLCITAPATPEKGIVKPEKLDSLISIFDQKKSNYDICKFVPASGAATRMFKRLIGFYNATDLKNLHDGGIHSVNNTFNDISKFAFFEKFTFLNSDNLDLKSMAGTILHDGLNYSSLPKGLIDFHKYADGSRTSFEEHLHEAIAMSDKTKPIDIHLTISREHFDSFNIKLNEIQEIKELQLNVSFSFQESSTNTIAIYSDESLVRDGDENLLLRPGGHGALLQNLNKIDSDIIFVKNIDNITHFDFIHDTVENKKLLGGILIETIENVKHCFDKLSTDNASTGDIDEICKYLHSTFGVDLSGRENIKEALVEFLNRPIRVCGMVKNTGEPGGGPFWVKSNNGDESLQIVEKAQIDLTQQSQAEIFNQSTHFNPVDLVCYLKNPEGKKFDLNSFVDKNACFISEKTHQGKDIRVLEHPGLWNGAMANWMTLFVEVPLSTFNPVKELNDLLKPMHQPKMS